MDYTDDSCMTGFTGGTYCLFFNGKSDTNGDLLKVKFYVCKSRFAATERSIYKVTVSDEPVICARTTTLDCIIFVQTNAQIL